MANCIAYESFSPLIPTGPSSVAPTATRCAIFYIDPESTARVRYRPDGTSPTNNEGIPLAPGSSIVVAGNASIRRSMFLVEYGGTATVHALYYDQVDVVDIGLPSTRSGSGVDLSPIVEGLDQILLELKRLRIGVSVMVSEDLEDLS